MTLHTLNASPSSAAFAECMQFISPGDTLLLLGDGVYAALCDTPASAELLTSGALLYVLRDDATAAGIVSRIVNATVIDIAGFVELTENHSRQMAWY